MWARRTSQQRNPQTARFNLLLLEDGEYFLDDYSAFRLVDVGTPAARKVQGRLKVCTRGLFFVPNDLVLPIVRFPFRWIPEIPTTTDVEGESKESTFMVRCKLTIEMRERGIDHPYVLKESPERADGSTVPFYFTLLYTSASAFIESLSYIYEVARLPRRTMNKAEEERLLASVLGPRFTVEFDPSLMVDYREHVLFSPSKLVNRIEPLLQYPGCLVMTDQR
ncbi:hypothetical protein PINS_up007836 [Pythium insidiosum]|nr:hypothetical protein PINS_up007836 [Pythium insidiosum]